MSCDLGARRLHRGPRLQERHAHDDARRPSAKSRTPPHPSALQNEMAPCPLRTGSGGRHRGAPGPAPASGAGGRRRRGGGATGRGTARGTGRGAAAAIGGSGAAGAGGRAARHHGRVASSASDIMTVGAEISSPSRRGRRPLRSAAPGPSVSTRLRDALAVEEGAVGAPLVDHRPVAAPPLEARVLSGDGDVVDHDVAARVAAHDQRLVLSISMGDPGQLGASTSLTPSLADDNGSCTGSRGGGIAIAWVIGYMLSAHSARAGRPGLGPGGGQGLVGRVETVRELEVRGPCTGQRPP